MPLLRPGPEAIPNPFDTTGLSLDSFGNMRPTVHLTAIPVALSLVLLLSASACRSVPGSTQGTPAPGELAAIVDARRASARTRFTDADVRFMTGMIGHHAQAITMAGWAIGHGASPTVATLAARISNAQTDEITIMQRWLRDRGQPVPDAGPASMAMHESGMSHSMLMPGMLTDAQMSELDAARGADFDRLFLSYMIQHHKGALVMVKELFAHDGAGQDETIFKFASDVNVDQTTEIARMERMLLLLKLTNGSP